MPVYSIVFSKEITVVFWSKNEKCAAIFAEFEHLDKFLFLYLSYLYLYIYMKWKQIKLTSLSILKCKKKTITIKCLMKYFFNQLIQNEYIIYIYIDIYIFSYEEENAEQNTIKYVQIRNEI